MQITQGHDLTDHQAFPFRQLLGYRPTRFGKDFASFEIGLDPQRHSNGEGRPHGGLYAVLLDTAMGASGNWTGPDTPRSVSVTLSLTVAFLAAPVGQRLIATGRRLGGGRSTYFTDGQVHDETGLLLATGSGVFRYQRAG